MRRSTVELVASVLAGAIMAVMVAVTGAIIEDSPVTSDPLPEFAMLTEGMIVPGPDPSYMCRTVAELEVMCVRNPPS